MPAGRDLAALGGLGLAAAVFFARLAQPGTWMPEGGGDSAGFLLPLFDYASRALRSGALPLWNPYLYSGAPLAADVQVGLFYPPNLALFLALPRITYGWMEAMAVAHFWWAGAGLYVCARVLRPAGARVGRPAAFVGALAFMFSDVFVTHFGNLNLIAAAAWLPWAFGPYYRAITETTARRAAPWAAAAAAAIGMAGLAGHPQPFSQILLVLLVVALVVAAGRLRSGRAGLREAARPLVCGAAAIVAGIGLAGVALVPAWELAGLTRRAALDAAAAAAYSVAPEQMSGLFVPSLFGRGMQRYWGPWPRVEAGFLGVGALALASVAIGVRLRRRDVALGVPVGLLVLLVLSAFVLALGDATPAYEAVRRAVPFLAGMRAPARFVLVADFGLALLAAAGVHVLLRRPAAEVRAALPAAALVLLALAFVAVPGAAAVVDRLAVMEADRAERLRQAAGGAALALAALAAVTGLVAIRLRGRLGDRALAGALGLVVFVELALAGAGLDWVDWDPTENHRPAAMSFLQSDPGLYRIEVRPEAWGWWSPSAAVIHDEFDVGGVYNPLVLADYQLYWESLTDRANPRYDFLNAKYVVAPKDFALPWDRFVPVFDRDPNLAIFLNTRAMPRARIVHRATVVGSHAEAWERVGAPDFDPAAEVVLEAAAAGGPSEPPADTAVAEVTGYRRGAIDVVTRSESPGYLVLSEVWYPGWRASLDGREVPILRANYAFRAVAVPAGSHDVRFRFRPSSVVLGAVVTLAAALAVSLLAAPALRRRVSPRT